MLEFSTDASSGQGRWTIRHGAVIIAQRDFGRDPGSPIPRGPRINGYIFAALSPGMNYQNHYFYSGAAVEKTGKLFDSQTLASFERISREPVEQREEPIMDCLLSGTQNPIVKLFFPIHPPRDPCKLEAADTRMDHPESPASGSGFSKFCSRACICPSKSRD